MMRHFLIKGLASEDALTVVRLGCRTESLFPTHSEIIEFAAMYDCPLEIVTSIREVSEVTFEILSLDYRVLEKEWLAWHEANLER